MIFLLFDKDDYLDIEYERTFDRILSHIRLLEKERINIVSRLYPNTIINNIYIAFEYEFLAIVDTLKLIEKQKYYAILSAIVVYKMLGFDHIV